MNVGRRLGQSPGHHHVGFQFQHHFEIDPSTVADFGDFTGHKALIDAGRMHHLNVADRNQIFERVQQFKMRQLRSR